MNSPAPESSNSSGLHEVKNVDPAKGWGAKRYSAKNARIRFFERAKLF